MTIKYVWHVSCQLHPTLDVHVVKKTEAFNIYRRHARLCLEIEEPKLVEIPFSIG